MTPRRSPTSFEQGDLPASPGPRRRTRLRIALAAICISTCALLTATATPALAAKKHLLTSSFATGASPVLLAINQSTGEVYVPLEGGSVSVFEASGAPDPATPELTGTSFDTPYGVGVDNSATSTAGDVYVADLQTVKQFNSSGAYTGIEINEASIPSGNLNSGFEPTSVAVASSGDIWVSDYHNAVIDEFDPSGNFIAQIGAGHLASAANQVAVDSLGNVYVAAGNGLIEFEPSGSCVNSCTPIDPEDNNSVAFDGSNDVYDLRGQATVIEYPPSGGTPIEQFGSGEISLGTGVAVNSTGAGGVPAGTAYVSDASQSEVHIFSPLTVPEITAEEAQSIQPTSVSLTGEVDPDGAGEITKCYFEYVSESEFQASGYNHASTTLCSPVVPYSTPTKVAAPLSGLQPGTYYHYRLAASNSNGTNQGEDQTYTTAQPPSITSLTSSNLSETTANLYAKVNPNDADTTYHFEYGTTTAYGNSVPVPSADIGSSDSAQSVTAHLSALQSHATYHFRLVAENKWGTTDSEDQSFNFFPSNCPNASIRQQTGASYLPDCRAYELVSPPRAGNIIFFIGGEGLAAPDAESPARFAFTGIFGAVSGTDPPNSDDVDTYVATRTDNGWVTNYVGIRGDEAPSATSAVGSVNLEKLIDFKEKEAYDVGVPQPPSRLPYAWDYNGSSLGRWPSDGPEIPGAEDSEGAFQPSPDFTHLAFSSNNVAFNTEGVTAGLGSAYDYNTDTGTTTLTSRTASGGNIELEPTNPGGATEYIRFPARYEDPQTLSPSVSTDGSHILMSTFATPQAPYGYFTYPTPPAGRLYMRVNDAVTYEVSQGHDVHYVGMTADGSKVFFTSDEQLTSEDHDTSTDLYMWSDATNSLTLISKGTEGTGNSDSCAASWTTQCNVMAVTGTPATGDSALASETGEIYFYSPEQLDGGKGVANGENLYVFREGRARFVASLAPGPVCVSRELGNECSVGPLTRIQVSPDGSHAAFVTASQLTAADTAGFQEMYSYDRSTGKIVCVSCNPTGEPPTGNVRASVDGLFMSDDGRTFFDSPDALVPQDTDKLPDIYEYVDGRPQLITSGTETEATLKTPNQVRESGLEGVSADGANVYFSTYDSLIPQDENGEFLKFYDARTNGGFPFARPPAPCAAADECHGAGSSPPPAPTITSGSDFGLGGNAHPGAGRRKSKRSKRQARTHKHHRQRKHHRRG